MGLISAWHAKVKSLISERITPFALEPLRGYTQPSWELHDVATTRLLETALASSSAQADSGNAAPARLMQRAGLAIARLALAISPHAETFWMACGPGNNGGDGLEAATHLKRWGKTPIVTLESTSPLARPGSADAAHALQAARDAGVTILTEPPSQFDAVIDALFGIGALRPWSATHAQWIERINSCGKPVLAVDVPSGLNADTGAATALHVQARHTLSLLTLKPGLLMGHGRDASGEIWFNNLGVSFPHDGHPAIARLLAPPPPRLRTHASHKGSLGDVCVVGGARGMTGAALLAGDAALHGGAGRVYVCCLDDAPFMVDARRPELMFRTLSDMPLSDQTVVAGCGGGSAIAAILPGLLDTAERLLLDADALNAISQDASLQASLRQRRRGSTILTPHPLEAARLLGGSTTQVQANRLKAAQDLVDKFQCTVVLKGSGTVVQAPGALPQINLSGNGRLATAGTGDVLAGLVGACWSAGAPAADAAAMGVFRHGQLADQWTGSALTASALAHSIK